MPAVTSVVNNHRHHFLHMSLDEDLLGHFVTDAGAPRDISYPSPHRLLQPKFDPDCF